MAKPQSVTVSAPIDTSATKTIVLCHGQSGEYLLKTLTFVPSEATTANASNKYVIAFTQGGTTIGTSLDSNTAAFEADTPQAVTLTQSAGASLEFGATDVLKIVATLTGSKDMAGTFVAAFEQVRV